MSKHKDNATMKQVDIKDGASADIVQENVEQLKGLFPEAFTENGVNFDTLRQLLGDLKVLDEGEEKFGLNWHGKKQARQIALTPSLGTLLPCPEESVDWDTTQNLFIEGDNLEVLKLLQKSYANKVKMIYIDPPYNTGKEFVYPDKFQDNLDTYLKYTGQIDDEGVKFTSNKETSGRKHTNWLNMMYPRLKLAKDLLRQDGVIFISIDDNEQANLKEICDEIFGVENFIDNVIWEKKYAPQNDAKWFSANHDHILVYADNKELWRPTLLPRTEEQNKRYTNRDNDHRGVWKSSDLSVKTYSEKCDYPITTPSGRIINPPKSRCWRTSEDKFQELVADNRIWFGENGDNVPSIKRFLTEVKDGIVPLTIWKYTEVGHNQDAAKEVRDLFDGYGYFDTPKPTKLLQRMIHISGAKENDLILDFFAGSASTTHAVLKSNAEYHNSLRHISVQLPEKLEEKSDAYKDGYKTIADIAKERIRRAAKKIQEENPEYEGDLGFKVFKLASSNIKVWNPDRTDIEASLLDHQEHLVEGRSEQDILYELLLKRGVDLTTPIETKQIAGKNVHSIGFGKIITCLDELITGDEVEELSAGIIAWQKELKETLDVQTLETHVFFRDSAFRDDIAKTNMAAILSQNGINHVRSL